jgi:hypothetical protein
MGLTRLYELDRRALGLSSPLRLFNDTQKLASYLQSGVYSLELEMVITLLR